MDPVSTIVTGLIAMLLWEGLRRAGAWGWRAYQARDALKRILSFPDGVLVSRSVVTTAGKRNIREPDVRVVQSLTTYWPNAVRHETEDPRVLGVDSPVSDLVVIGSPRYNPHAERLQQYFSLPYEYIYSSAEEEPEQRTLEIITEWGDELAASRDRWSASDGQDVDYGILFVGRLSAGRRIVWISGIHGIGTLGVAQYLKNHAATVLAEAANAHNEGTAWLLRILVGHKGGEPVVVDTERVGRPRKCKQAGRARRPGVLICDMGNVLMYFDRTRTYRALSHFLGCSYEEVRARIEATDLRQQFELGKLAEDEFVEELLRIAGDQVRVLTPTLVREFWGDIFWPNEQLLRALKTLKDGGVKLVLLSNTNSLHYQHIARDYPEVVGLFDRTFLSYEEGAAKPSAAFYERALREIWQMSPDVPVEDVLFVDDREENVLKAGELGMRSFLFRSYPHFVFWLRKLGLYIP